MPQRPIFTGKTLQYIEQSVAHWVASQGALPVMVPSPLGDTSRGTVGFDDYAAWLDGLVLMGGSDMWPGHYGEEPLQAAMGRRPRPRRVRDRAGTRLRGSGQAGVRRVPRPAGAQRRLRRHAAAGHQPAATANRWRTATPTLYDKHFHAVEFVPGTRLAQLYPGTSRVTVNSVHHQGIKTLAPDFVVEARCPDDQLIEAVRWRGPELRGRGAVAPGVSPPRRARRDRRRADPEGLSRRARGRAPRGDA